MTAMEHRLNTLQAEVGLWSMANFGLQEDKNSGFKPTYLNEKASLLGIVEEVGEFYENAQKSLGATEEEKLALAEEGNDALADIIIYLLDHCDRQRIYLGELVAPHLPHTPTGNAQFRMACLHVGVGRLCHAKLKQAQGIRGFDKPAYALEKIKEAITTIYLAVNDIGLLVGLDVLDNVEKVWQKVKQRNWKKDAQGKHTS